jgi:uncharacterized membrane protein YiaA
MDSSRRCRCRRACATGLTEFPVTAIYYGLSWVSVMLCLLLMTAGLWNATIAIAEKGFYGMAYLLSLFAAITVQKNTRDSVDTPAMTLAAPDQE